MRHVPVLLDEVVASLQLMSNGNVVDGTLGDGGHADALLQAVAPNGRLLGIDLDPESLLRAKRFLYGFGKRVVYVRDSFANMKAIVEGEEFGPVHGILLDLGWSSPQFEERRRGFSFQKDEPLDMRFAGAGARPTAAALLAELSGEELAQIFSVYGEEKFAKDIAQAITDAREKAPVETTGQLVEIILSVYRKRLRSKAETPWVGGLHPATKVFQALRIAVNDEMTAIKEVLPQAVDILEPGGRLAVITFHSGEDRIVKHWFKSEHKKTVRIITKKPVIPTKEEMQNNPRAASAKLRVVEKI